MEVLGLMFQCPIALNEFPNLNQRGHWAKRAAPTAALRFAAKMHFANAIRDPRSRWRRNMPFTTIMVDLPVRRVGLRRDPSNWSPTVKALVDGMCDAGCWPDDDMLHVATTEPIFHEALTFPHIVVQATIREDEQGIACNPVQPRV